MGVNNLETFLKIEVPNGFVEVDLMMEIEKFKRLNHNQRPILIFDIMSIVGYLCENKIEILCGGCHDFYHYHLSQIFSTLGQNCELIFFMDGYVQMDSKFSTWRKRQNEKYKDNLAIISDIHQGRTLSEIIRKHRYIYANSMLNVIEDVAIKFGTLNYAIKFECDQEVAQFAALQWRTLAVFSDDSDFLIFGGRWRYFSMKYFNSACFKSMEYNRYALRTYLDLNVFQMSIFATCLGNDILSNKSIASFHKKFNDKILDIADFIRNNIKDMKTHSDVLDFLVIAIFGVGNDYFKQLISKSINSYFINYQAINEEGPFDYLLQYHMLFTRNVLSDAPFNFSLIFYDLQEYPKSLYDISIELFQRQAGIVFAQVRMDPFPLRIYSKISHGESYEMLNANPIVPPFEVLSMEEIQSENMTYDYYRLMLLAWTVCWDKLSNFNLQQIPRRYMIDILTLVYLVQKEALTSKEADLILYSIQRTYQRDTISRPPNRLDPRAFHIAFLYTRMFANVQRSIEVCGLKKKYWKPLNFNGSDFHNLYIIFKDKDFDPQTYLGNIKLTNI